jgi:hypothetical protein
MKGKLILFLSWSRCQVPKDGLDNKDRWHWKERDLRTWINEWLMRAFVQFDGGKLFADPDCLGRVSTVRVCVLSSFASVLE